MSFKLSSASSLFLDLLRATSAQVVLIVHTVFTVIVPYNNFFYVGMAIPAFFYYSF